MVELTPEEMVEAVVKVRAEAKAAGDFGRADLIRKRCLEEGIVLEDHADGRTSWRVK